MTNALNNILDQAQAAADNFVQSAPAVTNPVTPASVNTGANLPSTLAGAMANTGAVVDEYLVVTPDGMKVSKDMKGVLDELIVTIEMGDVSPVAQLRTNIGGAIKFHRGYNAVTTTEGKNFQAEHDKAIAAGGMADLYTTVEIPCVLTEDIADPREKSRMYPAGTEVGLTPSITGYSEFVKFTKKLMKSNPTLLEANIKVKMTHKVRTNTKGNTWGVVCYEFLGVED